MHYLIAGLVALVAFLWWQGGLALVVGVEQFRRLQGSPSPLSRSESVLIYLLWPLWRLEAEFERLWVFLMGEPDPPPSEEPPFLTAPPGRGS